MSCPPGGQPFERRLFARMSSGDGLPPAPAAQARRTRSGRSSAASLRPRARTTARAPPRRCGPASSATASVIALASLAGQRPRHPQGRCGTHASRPQFPVHRPPLVARLHPTEGTGERLIPLGRCDAEHLGEQQRRLVVEPVGSGAETLVERPPGQRPARQRPPDRSRQRSPANRPVRRARTLNSHRDHPKRDPVLPFCCHPAPRQPPNRPQTA